MPSTDLPKRRPLSLSTRLIVFLSLLTVGAFAIFNGFILQSVAEHFYEMDAGDLRQIHTTMNRVLAEETPTEAAKLDRLRAAAANWPNAAVLITSPSGDVLFSSTEGTALLSARESADFAAHRESGAIFTWEAPNANALSTKEREDEAAPTQAEASSTHMHHGAASSGNGRNAYRVIASSGRVSFAQASRPYEMLVALSIDFHLHYIETLKQNLLLIAAAISLIVIAVIRLAVSRGLAPLREVSTAIKNITSKNLDVRLDPERVPLELSELVTSFNHMIGKIEDVFTRQANFSADIAHEIRTPVTNLMTQTEIALSQSRSQKELEDVLYSNLEEYHRMTRMISDMLFLAQADNNQLIPDHALLDLKTEVVKVFEFFEAWAEERAVKLELKGEACLVQGDALMLRRAISNLLSNAVRYTPANQAVTVTLTQSATTAEVSVENPGKPIASEHLPKLFDRFYRVDPSRRRMSEGSGIGLCIVKSIITAHKGSIRVESDVRSTRFIIELPKVAPSNLA